jgi:hypothetical protein
LHIPVAVEDVAQFTAIYGDDAPLAWDKGRGELVTAYLAPAVRAFFGNGGRRCWVVRVARQVPTESDGLNRARSNYFPIPGLALAQLTSSGNIKDISPAFARARSEGSWSDSLRVSSALLSRPVQVTGPVQPAGDASEKLKVLLALNSSKDVGVGDLLRLTFKEGYLLFMVVEAAEAEAASPPGGSPPERQTVRVTSSKFAWFRTSALASPPPPLSQIKAYVFTSEPEAAAGSPPLPDNDQLSLPDFNSRPLDVLNEAADWPIADSELLSIKLALPAGEAPAPGSLMRIDVGQEQLWLAVQEQGVKHDEGSPPGEAVQVIGQGYWWSANEPAALPGSTPNGERLNFELWCRRDEESVMSISDLGFEAGHPRYWANLPTDAERYEVSDTDFDKGRVEMAFDKEPVQLWRPTKDQLFPLAGNASQNIFYLPLAVPVLPEQYLDHVKLPGTERERDGLARFDASLFLDPAMTETFTGDLMTQADFIRFLGPSPRKLIGLHAALCIEEATLLSVPDAVHLGWFKTSLEGASQPQDSLPLPHPEWWHFLPCKPRQVAHPCCESDKPSLVGVEESGLAAPELTSLAVNSQPGTFMLSWSNQDVGDDAEYILEESLDPDFSEATGIYYGAQRQLAIYGRGTGSYYYRVRVRVGDWSSDWSNGVILSGKIPLVHEPLRGHFLPCDIRVIEPPLLQASESITQTGTFTLTWELSLPAARFILEEATSPDFNGAVVIYQGTETRLNLYGNAQGDYFYRVRAEVRGLSSDWSNGVAVRVTSAVEWQLNSVDLYTTDALLAVQRAMVRMCAGRGDLFAILTMPEHYREDQAIEYVRTLKATTGPAITFTAPGIDPLFPLEKSLLSFPLGEGEKGAFSYSAIYHPWLINGEQSQTRAFKRNPPDGTICGVFAKRALERGAWIAPANELLRDVIALASSILRGRRLDLQEAQINLIRQEPRGFVALSADTLSDDEDLRPINVRRLLILLRRLALGLGARYVFEPQSESFRRLVQRSFEGMLDRMFERGAFAGATPATSFQVVTNSSLNTPQSVEQGRFIVELKVAPSLPLTFLTVRLVQTNDRGFVTEGR